MEVFAEVNLASDIPYWIARESFYRYFDQENFLNREVRDVQSAYLKDWFPASANGTIKFLIPVVSAIAAKTDLISSRHRLAVLLPHLEQLPIAIATRHLQPDAREFWDTIPKCPLDPAAPFWIPDFPIRDTLPSTDNSDA